MNISATMNEAQSVVTGAIAKAIKSGDLKLVVAAAAGATALGAGILVYEYSQGAAKGIYAAADGLVESVSQTVLGWFLPSADELAEQARSSLQEAGFIDCEIAE